MIYQCVLMNTQPAATAPPTQNHISCQSATNFGPPIADVDSPSLRASSCAGAALEGQAGSGTGSSGRPTEDSMGVRGVRRAATGRETGFLGDGSLTGLEKGPGRPMNQPVRA